MKTTLIKNCISINAFHYKNLYINIYIINVSLKKIQIKIKKENKKLKFLLLFLLLLMNLHKYINHIELYIYEAIFL